MKKYIFILGSHPDIAFQELETLLPDCHVQKKEYVVFVESKEALDASLLMNQLGGTVKIIEYVDIFEKDRFVDWLFEQINTETKFHFGFSDYTIGSKKSNQKRMYQIHRMGIELKQAMKKNGISARYVQSKEPILSSVIVHKERLLKNGVEVVFITDQEKTIFGKTLAVQPFAEFARRDFGRPGHDARSGMLPPKLARMMIQIATPKLESVILDPFCGSGTILQEAFVLGYTHLIGSDKSEKAIQNTQKNMRWIKAQNVSLHIADAQTLAKEKIIEKKSIDRIIFEGYLGPPTPHISDIERIASQLERLYASVFPELRALLKSDGMIVAALPFWKKEGKEFHLDIFSILKKSTLTQKGKSLFYRREQSTVGREIIQLVHKSSS